MYFITISRYREGSSPAVCPQDRHPVLRLLRDRLHPRHRGGLQRELQQEVLHRAQQEVRQ